jgi:aminoglycoside/choline kinase family phosphotransferase
MQIIDEIPKQPYAEIVRLLLAAGSVVPDKVGEDGESGGALIAELGIEPPA